MFKLSPNLNPKRRRSLTRGTANTQPHKYRSQDYHIFCLGVSCFGYTTVRPKTSYLFYSFVFQAPYSLRFGYSAITWTLWHYDPGSSGPIAARPQTVQHCGTVPASKAQPPTPSHRPLSGSFLWFIFRIHFKRVIPKRSYLGAYGYSPDSPDKSNAWLE